MLVTEGTSGLGLEKCLGVQILERYSGFGGLVVAFGCLQRNSILPLSGLFDLGEGREDFKNSSKPYFRLWNIGTLALFAVTFRSLELFATGEQAATSKMASFFLISDSSLQRPPCQEQQPARRPAATPLASRAWLRPRDPSRQANGELRMALPAQAWQSGVTSCLGAWEDFVGRGGGEKVLEAVGRWPLHLFQPPRFPGVAEPQRNQAAQIWRVAYSL